MGFPIEHAKIALEKSNYEGVEQALEKLMEL